MSIYSSLSALRNRGVVAALLAAALFGASAPLAKRLLDRDASPWLLAALLYLGSGLGLALWRHAQRPAPVRLTRGDAGWLAGAIAAGGLVAPVLLMLGLAAMPAASASLLLNAESVFTALLAWAVFRENADRRIVLGMLAIVAGTMVLAWPGERVSADLWPALAVLGACLAWGLDNNLTRKVALIDASFIAMAKGLVAGATNLALALAAGTAWPSAATVLATAVLGFLGYGASLALFVVALRSLGAARTGAYFSVAPFFGAALALVLAAEPPSMALLIAGALMALGVWLHLSERHTHEHYHEAMEHTHEHVHDGHHQHEHPDPVEPGMRHTHPHRHEPMTHSHEHFPDVHHRHGH